MDLRDVHLVSSNHPRPKWLFIHVVSVLLVKPALRPVVKLTKEVRYAIIEYGSTLYVGMTWEKNGVHISRV